GPQVSRMMDEAHRGGHRRDVFDAEVAALPELRKDLGEIGAQFLECEGARLGVGHRAILKVLRDERVAPIANVEGIACSARFARRSRKNKLSSYLNAHAP